ncbi:hypothetical protein K3495_g13219 [Podosphaera aphanis]|nr:hypothetical protein K3495_g13219 [Podosphaera aphanis]
MNVKMDHLNTHNQGKEGDFEVGNSEKLEENHGDLKSLFECEAYTPPQAVGANTQREGGETPIDNPDTPVELELKVPQGCELSPRKSIRLIHIPPRALQKAKIQSDPLNDHGGREGSMLSTDNLNLSPGADNLKEFRASMKFLLYQKSMEVIDKSLSQAIHSSKGQTNSPNAISQGEENETSSDSVDNPYAQLSPETLKSLRTYCEVAHEYKLAQKSKKVVRATPHTTLESRHGLSLSLLSISRTLLRNKILELAATYTATNNYWLKFKSSAKFLERRFTPIVNTVSSIGRISDVCDGVRWILGGRILNSCHFINSADDVSRRFKKRARSHGEENTAKDQFSTDQYHPFYDRFKRCRSLSIDSLSSHNSKESFMSDGVWSPRLSQTKIIHNFEISDKSLGIFRYCLDRLKLANGRLEQSIEVLKVALEQYGRTCMIEDSARRDDIYSISQSKVERSTLGARIEKLIIDTSQTMKEVFDTISKCHVGTKPDISRVLEEEYVRNLPGRFQKARIKSIAMIYDRITGSKIFAAGNRRTLILAKLVLVTMGFVSRFLNNSIMSLEKWCNDPNHKRKNWKKSLHQLQISSEVLSENLFENIFENSFRSFTESSLDSPTKSSSSELPFSLTR